MIDQPATMRFDRLGDLIPTATLGVTFAILLVGTTASGQGLANHRLGPAETIIAQQVISDHAVPTNSYVGDLPQSDCSDGSCGDGTSTGVLGGGQGLAAGRSYGQPDLFYNYYTQGHANAVNAQIYVSPLPVPKHVGHTYNTYQPFYPEEYLYWHKNRFHKYYDNGRGMNRTRATYYSPPVRQAISNLYWNKLRIPR